MPGMFKAHKAGYFYGRQGITGKYVVFFSKREYLQDWIKESFKRHEITARQAHDILGEDYARAFKMTLDKEVVEPDPEYTEILQSRIKKPNFEFDAYRDFYRGYAK